MGIKYKPKDKDKSPVEHWSAARYRAFIVSALRNGFRRYPNKHEAIKAAYVETKTNPASGRKAKFYRCEKCRKSFVRTKVQVDHITPIVDPAYGFINWDFYVSRMFCSVKNLQVLCIECHKKKTEKEKKQR